VKDSHICVCFLDSAKVQLLAELDGVLFQIYHLVGCIWDQLEAEKVGVDELELGDVGVHQAEVMLLLVLETVRIGPNFLDLLLLGEQVEQNEELALHEA
jgi:hypothetical protein